MKNSSPNTANDGIIVILSYPDTVVRPAYREFSSKIWPKLGVGNKHAVQAGHAALLLIRKNNPDIHYFDFGRYITSTGNGRTRSEKTDPELKVEVKAVFEKNNLKNIEEILLWIENHPEKTHGSGRLIAGIHNNVNYEKASKFITNLVEDKELPYGAFIKKGTNCARFVTDAIIKSTTNKKIKKHLKNSKIFTPSPIGNVIKATTSTTIYEVFHQKITYYQNRSILKEYKNYFFNKFETALNLIGTELPDLKSFSLENGTWLGGIGSGAWFNIENQIDAKNYTIARYDSLGKKEFEGKFLINNNTFKIDEKYEFVYPTNCVEIHILQNDICYLFNIHFNNYSG